MSKTLMKAVLCAALAAVLVPARARGYEMQFPASEPPGPEHAAPADGGTDEAFGRPALGKNKAMNEKKHYIFLNRTEPEGGIEIPIAPPEEFDLLSKREIYRRRTVCVNKFPQLYNGTYEPSDAVFGGIESGKTWWGLLGLCYYGNGMDSIKGESEESRFILNPYLLVALNERYAFRISGGPAKLEPRVFYPMPLRLVWSRDGTSGHAWYDVSTFFEECLLNMHPTTAEKQELELVMYNARDLGLPYCAVDGEGCRNVSTPLADGQAHFIPFMLHCGASSGYPGGSNNMSPDAPEFSVTINDLPAELVIKLWRREPADAGDPADVTFTISMD